MVSADNNVFSITNKHKNLLFLNKNNDMKEKLT